jgi:hypothetical protein
MRTLPAFTALFLAACGGLRPTAPPDTSPDTADTQADADTDADSDSDSDTDADTDADVDADTDADTDADPGRNGTYRGSVTVDATALFGTMDVDSCSGTATVEVDEATYPQVAGTFDCTFASTLSILGPVEGTLEGNLSSSSHAVGTLDFGMIFEDAVFDGSFSGDTFQAGFEAEVDVIKVMLTIDFQGQLSATR